MNTTDIRRLLSDVLPAVEVPTLPPGTKAKRHCPLEPLAEGERRVRDARMDEVRAGLDKLNIRAQKLGLDPVCLEIVRVEDVERIAVWHDGFQWVWARTGEVVRFHVLRASAAPVRLAGWTFLATIQHLGEENLVRTAPHLGEDALPPRFRTEGPTCDHCRTVRRRHDTFVLRHEDGRHARVGRNCLADFLGGQNADAVLWAATLDLDGLLGEPADFEDDGDGWIFGPRRALPRAYLATVALVIDTHGWLSRSAARQVDREATADTAWAVLFPPPSRARKDGLSTASITDVHLERAEQALVWARSIPADTPSDYLHNVRVVAGLESWSAREIGIGASVLAAWLKEQEKLARMAFERRLPSLPLGTVGLRFGAGKGKKAIPPIRARVLGTHPFEGEFGLTTIVRMQVPGPEGHVHDLVWFASGSVSIQTDLAAEEAERAAEVAVRVAEEADQPRLIAAEIPEWSWSSHWADAVWEARHARDVAQRTTREGIRDLAAGDLVDLTGTVKVHQTSKKTGRVETVLSRCVLGFVPEGDAEAK